LRANGRIHVLALLRAFNVRCSPRQRNRGFDPI
jgi:hypothetical protein